MTEKPKVYVTEADGWQTEVKPFADPYARPTEIEVRGRDGWMTKIQLPDLDENGKVKHAERKQAATITDKDGWQTKMPESVLEEYRSERTSDPADLRMPPMPDPSFGRAIGAPQSVLTAPIARPMLPVATPVRNMPKAGGIPRDPVLRIPRDMFVREVRPIPTHVSTESLVYRADCARNTIDIDLALRPPGTLLHEYVFSRLENRGEGEVFADGLQLNGSTDDGVHAAISSVHRFMVEVPDELQRGPGILDLPLVGLVSSYPSFARHTLPGAHVYVGRVPQLHTPAASVTEIKKFGQGANVRLAYQRDISTNWLAMSAAGTGVREKRPTMPPVLFIDYHQFWAGYVRIDKKTNTLVAEKTALTKQVVLV